ncbi:polysaccharide pyruvyl transferase family protein [Terribacillus saccharophilus]|uniref:polysaccharide pyruvyl transferase family protein n=1 Tax=Terribacillus saccharophilus TaxID=361277 RepID=UPI002989A9D9|nr:polysaccharide pyruvyl transferase family protein [Terribacillus saccharophilus]MCM3225237.1 polysaccharide pyruvyl transferase family protein [Terribacillus saccharophilus]
MKKIVIWGYYGSNYGDDIMLRVILDYLIEKKISVEVIDGYNNNLEERLVDFKSNSLVKVTNFRELSKLKKLFKLWDLKSAKINLWGGGTVFTDEDGDGNYKFFRALSYLGGKFGYVGVGIGNLEKVDRIKHTRWLLKRSVLTVFRDDTSLKRANIMYKQNDYILAEDLSYKYFDDYRKSNQTKHKLEPYVLLTWRNLIGYFTEAEELKLMKNTLDSIKGIMMDKGIKNLKLLPLDSKFDEASCDKIIQLCKSLNIEVTYDRNLPINKQTNLILNSSYHISGRLHGSIASEFFNVPTVGLAYSPKMIYFYNSINSKKFLDIKHDEINYKNLVSKLKEDSEKISSEFIQSASKNLEILDNYIC